MWVFVFCEGINNSIILSQRKNSSELLKNAYNQCKNKIVILNITWFYSYRHEKDLT